MPDLHEPTEEFAEKLEWQIGRELRRRNTAAQAPGWITWSRGKLAGAVAALVIVSMAIGGAAVAAAYEAQGNQLREQIASNFEQRLRLAEARLATVRADFDTVQQRVSVGVATAMDLMDSQNKVTEAEVQLQKLQLEIEEVRLTGREPRHELSAPTVSGRDFVGQRLRIDMLVPERALSLERARLSDVQKRLGLGLTGAGDVEAARVRVLEAQAALEALRTKIEIRQKFLGGGIDAKEAELRVLEAEAGQQKLVLTSKLELARHEVQHVTQRVETGTAQQVELAMAKLRLLEQETALSKADLDLTLIRAQLAKIRKKE